MGRPDTKQIDNLVIGHRFRGPPHSGNGGYVCGRLAELLEGPAKVRLMRPPPLDTHLAVVTSDDGLELRNGDDVVALAWQAGPEIDVPPAPDLDAARQGRKNFPGHIRHVFPGCFVCGVDRAEGDGLLIHAGPDSAPNQIGRLERGQVAHHVSCTWSPHDSLCGNDGIVPQHFIWAALDCPSGWAFLAFGEEIALLGELSAEVVSPVRCGIDYTIAGWEIGRQGRKRQTGSALYDSDGEWVARAEATWIVIDPPGQ